MTTAAIYSRFSTDKQDRSSIDDQTRTCRGWAKARGVSVVDVFADEATSGSTRVLQRPGGAAMHAAALARRFDVLILEGLDRLSRDQVDQEQVVRRLEHRGIRIVGVADGYDSEAGPSRILLRGMRGLVNEVYLRDLPHKIRRGLAGQIERGFHAGGLSYGYQSLPVGTNARGEAEGFRLDIVPNQAEIVREIFARYAAGESLQRIAADLNLRCIPGPGRKRAKPSTWSVAALYGTPRAGTGLLNNELYVGRYIWNRREWVKDPDNPVRRIPRLRPQAEWHIAARPELRIVDDEIWQAVRVRMDRPRKRGGQRGRGRAPRTLFGGLLRCSICGGAMVAVHRTYYGCAAHKDRGDAVCAGTFAPRAGTDRRIVTELRNQVFAPAAMARIQARVHEILTAMQPQADHHAKARKVRIAALEGEVTRLAEAVAEMGLSNALKKRLATAESELASLKSVEHHSVRIAMPDPRAIRKRIHEVGLQLEAALASDISVARTILAQKLGDIVVEEQGDGVYAKLDIGPVLLQAVGADVDRTGCGGRI